MAQESLSLESSKVAPPAALGWQGSSLKWKFGTAFAGLILLLGVATAVLGVSRKRPGTPVVRPALRL